MKRIFLLSLLAVLISGIATAQNANRNGFFLEAGIGGLVGNTPRTSVLIMDNIVYNKFLYGSSADFGLGGRIRIGNHWAYEVKAEAMIPLNDPINAIIGRVLPVGFRFTSGEFWRNYSMYAHVNLGGAMTGMGGQFIRYDDNFEYSTYMGENSYNGVIIPEGSTIKLKIGAPRGGVAYSLGTGINLTTHLYVEGCYNAQLMFNCYGKNGSRILHFGAVSAGVGYRF